MNYIVNFVDRSIELLAETVNTIDKTVQILLIVKKTAEDVDNITKKKSNILLIENNIENIEIKDNV
jgi:hypothetical protein